VTAELCAVVRILIRSVGIRSVRGSLQSAAEAEESASSSVASGSSLDDAAYALVFGQHKLMEFMTSDTMLDASFAEHERASPANHGV
jgi:hypothetical protein